MRRRLHRALLLGAVSQGSLQHGCAAAPDDLEYCRTSAALVGGGPSTSYLAIGTEASAIGVLASPRADGFCVGSRIARRWVLSAAHCSGLPEAIFTTSGAPAIPTLRVVEHDSSDVALFELDLDDCESTTSLPLARLASAAPRLSRATVAGLVDADGLRNAVGFLTEAVVQLDADYVAVDGRGKTGACSGDSGGPLLVRDDSGRVAVLGVLSKGEASCRGVDYYARVDTLRVWVEEVVGALPEPRQSCGNLTDVGRCFDDQAVWCESGELTARLCGTGSCGWSPLRGGFRCNEGPVCEGDDAGRCEGDRLVECASGKRIEMACADGCGYDPRSGDARCE